MSIAQKIRSMIVAKDDGAVFSAKDFYDLDAFSGNIDVILHRLSDSGLIRRLGYGLYDKPIKSPLLGDLTPSIDSVIKCYGKKLSQTFVLDPSHAANLLGLTTQVPAKLVYLTNGKTHDISICGLKISFVHASPKTLLASDRHIGLVFQALRYFGNSGAPFDILKKISNMITDNDRNEMYSMRGDTYKILGKQIETIYAIH